MLTTQLTQTEINEICMKKILIMMQRYKMRYGGSPLSSRRTSQCWKLFIDKKLICCLLGIRKIRNKAETGSSDRTRRVSSENDLETEQRQMAVAIKSPSIGSGVLNCFEPNGRGGKTVGSRTRLGRSCYCPASTAWPTALASD